MANKTMHHVSLKKPGAGQPSSGQRYPAAGAGSPRDTVKKPETISKLSHDIRTQLYIIIGFAELMLEEIPGKINDEQRRNLDDVLKSGRRLLELLDDIVKPSEGKSGSVKEG